MHDSAIPIVLVAGLLGACAGDAEPRPDVRTTAQSIVNGTLSTAAQDYTVLIGLEEGGKQNLQCSGTLIAKRLVLTAHHCVGDFAEGTQSVADYAPPSKLSVFTGVDAPSKVQKGKPDVRVSEIVHTPGTDLLPDIALLVLENELASPIAPIRLDGGAKVGELITVVGYGATQANTLPLKRQQRTGLKIVKKAPGDTQFFKLEPGEFAFGEAACVGDSGGPAISEETGALVGLGTRVGNGKTPSTPDVANFCLGPSTEDLYTDLTPVKGLIEAAFSEVGAKPWREGGPTPEEQAAAEAATKSSTEPKAAPPPADSGCAASGAGRAASPHAVVAAMLGLALTLAARQKRQRSKQ